MCVRACVFVCVCAQKVPLLQVLTVSITHSFKIGPFVLTLEPLWIQRAPDEPDWHKDVTAQPETGFSLTAPLSQASLYLKVTCVRQLWCLEAVQQHRKAPSFLFQKNRCFICLFFFFFLRKSETEISLFTLQTKSSIVSPQLIQTAQESVQRQK